MIQIEVDEAERQFLLLSLALCVLLRPGFNLPAETLADKLDGREMYDGFRECNADSVKPQRSWIDQSIEFERGGDSMK